MTPTFLYTPPSPPVRQREILRYAGISSGGEAFLPAVQECLAEMQVDLVYKICYRFCPVLRDSEGLSLGFARVQSSNLERLLQGYDTALVFAATVGLAPDRQVQRYLALSETKALLSQAIGAERIESLCDAFAKALSEGGYDPSPRFSPGYGDLPLGFQKNLFSYLSCEKHIGLTLNESLIMSPTKSVSALMGVRKKEQL